MLVVVSPGQFIVCFGLPWERIGVGQLSALSHNVFLEDAFILDWSLLEQELFFTLCPADRSLGFFLPFYIFHTTVMIN